MITLIFLIAALVIFLIAAINIPVPKINLIALGLACWVVAQLVTSAKF